MQMHFSSSPSQFREELVARPLRGEGGKGLATKKKTFFEALKNFPKKFGH